MASSIVEFFSGVPDPRSGHGRRHVFSDMVAIAICAVVCGAEGWVDVEVFGKAKEKWFRTFLELPHGIPSHDTFGRVFGAIDPEQFERCFRAWTEALAGVIVGAVALDGNTIRRSFDKAGEKVAIHMISAWAADNRVVFGQLAVGEKTTTTRHYYVTSLDTRRASEAARVCRAHCQVENSLH